MTALDLAPGVSVAAPDLKNLPPAQVPAGSVRLVLHIDNTYELHPDVETYADVVVPAPPARDAVYAEGDEGAGEHQSPYEGWVYDHIYCLTGVGQTRGDSWYDVEVLWSSDPSLSEEVWDFGY